MNKHASRQYSMNTLRKNRNSQEIIFVQWVVKHIIHHVNAKASFLSKEWQFPILFDYSLTATIRLKQRKAWIQSYRLRDSKIEEIIALLESEDSWLIMAFADRFTDGNGNILLEMIRA